MIGQGELIPKAPTESYQPRYRYAVTRHVTFNAGRANVRVSPLSPHKFNLPRWPEIVVTTMASKIPWRGKSPFV